MDRRHFIKTAIGSCAVTAHAVVKPRQDLGAMTVSGWVASHQLGLVLPHEHVLVDFGGAETASPDRYNAEEVADVARPHLEKAKALGLGTLVECTPAYLARDPVLLRNLAGDTGLHVITNTGYYGAAGDAFIPAHAYEESPEQLAKRWVAEWENGIGDTGIRPGFIKTAVDPGPLSEIDAKLIRAAALTQRETGLAIASHTTDAESLWAELAILDEEDVAPDRFIWVHAHSVDDSDVHRRAAQKGIWVELDGLGPKSVEAHVRWVKTLRDTGYLDQVLVSHDAGWYTVGEPGGGTFRGYETLFDAFIPALKGKGFTDGDIHRITHENPARAFSVSRR